MAAANQSPAPAVINNIYVFALSEYVEHSNFDVQMDGHYEAPPIDWLTASTFTLYNVDKNTDYWLWVGDHNVDRTGPLSATTLSTILGPVVDLDVDSATSSSFRVTCAQSSDLGGNPITQYNVYQKTNVNSPSTGDVVATLGADYFS